MSLMTDDVINFTSMLRMSYDFLHSGRKKGFPMTFVMELRRFMACIHQDIIIWTQT